MGVNHASLTMSDTSVINWRRSLLIMKIASEPEVEFFQ